MGSDNDFVSWDKVSEKPCFESVVRCSIQLSYACPRRRESTNHAWLVQELFPSVSAFKCQSLYRRGLAETGGEGTGFPQRAGSAFMPDLFPWAFARQARWLEPRRPLRRGEVRMQPARWTGDGQDFSTADECLRALTASMMGQSMRRFNAAQHSPRLPMTP